MSDKLLAGFARVDISPEESVPLAGYGNTSRRMSTVVTEPLHANALALTGSDGHTVLVMVLDMGNMYPPLPDFRRQLSEAVDLPLAQVMVCCTHTHSAPHLSNDEKDSIPRYREKLHRCMIQCAREALEDRKEATVQVSSIQTRSMNFVRRYILEDGTYAGDNYGHPKLSPYKCHETDADPMMQVVKFTRTGGKDIIMANFQGHPHKAGGSKRYECTSDLVGIFRQQLEQNTGAHALYFTGASGNLNCNSRIPGEDITANHIEHGKALAAYALEALKNLRPAESGMVRNFQLMYEGTCNHTEDHKVPQAEIVAERWKTIGKASEALAGYEDLFNSPYHALSVISKAQRPQTMTVELNGIRIGDVSMVFAPFELFDGLGVIIKEGSPFESTFVCCYANALFSYLPTKLGFEHGGYGPNQCRFTPGTGEIIAEKFLEILRRLNEN